MNSQDSTADLAVKSRGKLLFVGVSRSDFFAVSSGDRYSLSPGLGHREEEPSKRRTQALAGDVPCDAGISLGVKGVGVDVVWQLRTSGVLVNDVNGRLILLEDPSDRSQITLCQRLESRSTSKCLHLMSLVPL
eukprot:Cvel_16862.t1-p1 / transcript=Cvel_16862.t1 / gene=Cvel_16862 / organism=Chromera_velia_CCMP2878 / gene_product=hypothetical protein / transcript_product=hypothetical protein / location=Cvel_scaffold1318:39859-50200(+) / protein_length=132 / sequence_SO=supercontig / SO=protein_coding / is_pseudo=false